ncbi:exopolysaccharide biosynthesis polyprenyl glycosylphosphotransferase [Sphingorhabdus sp. Alg239-R122]|uniref:exopolysaccharide biosynthesis polyprenyl glycosylphosphotransferase n=1 Tax=Sphingorhabdus sp. Alg239-R122 TaxID=2305989 RepID=UPI0013DC7CFD|nr:exopolysaccharide biosynthesis polyprenyl glycosylphosphotransferase [Sphingorhabdus sp. Alg239-R122]
MASRANDNRLSSASAPGEPLLAFSAGEDYDGHVLNPETQVAVQSRGKGRKRVALSLLAATLDLTAIITAFTIACIVRLGGINTDQLFNLLVVTIPIYFGIAFNNRAYNIRALVKFGTSLQRGTLSLIFAVAAVMLMLFFLKVGAEFSRLIFAMGTVGSIVLIACGRLLVRQIAWKMLGRNPMSELVIYDRVEMKEQDSADAIDAKVNGIHPDSSNPLNIQRLGLAVQDMDYVIVRCKPEHRNDWAHALKALDVNGQIIMPELAVLAPLSMTRYDGQVALTVSSGPLKWNQRLLKRAFDIAFVFAALPVLAIPMLITAIAIKLESPGPVLFKQSRIGLGNRPFSILKFRSMAAEKCDAHGEQSTSRTDSRVTKVGAFIRKTSIDELPQLFNVLMGDMSVVGPRPHAVGSTAEDALFWDIDHRYWHRHTIKPGLTGLAQIRGFRGATEKRSDLEGRLQSDLEYRTTWSLWNDIKIVLLTFRVLVHKNAF